MTKLDKKARLRRSRRTAAFTLVEMMVVVVVIAILIAGVFRLMKAVEQKNKEAQTKARLQKLQNAMSAFYSEYGTYPPVAYYGSQDPYTEQSDLYTGDGTLIKDQPLTAENALRAARCQPSEYLYPSPKKWNKGINRMFKDENVRNANEVLARIVRDRSDTAWSDGLRAFRFGLLSFLLPRLTLMGGKSDGSFDEQNSPDVNFVQSRQWNENNPGSLREIYEREQMVIARWLPNFERFPLRGVGTVMGVQTGDGHHDNLIHLATVTDPKTKQSYKLIHASMYDGWGREFFYYSAPPYQSYRVWSAGADGRTFPPGATPKNSDRKTVAEWTGDDIVLFDR